MLISAVCSVGSITQDARVYRRRLSTVPSSCSLDDQQCSGTWQPQLNHAEIASWIAAAVISCHDTAG